MKSYPYIGKGRLSKSIFLFFNTGEALVLDFGRSTYSEHEKGIQECLCKNITTEYLANTYGEVKSKEHAEFIVRLCKNADIIIYNDFFNGAGFFYVFKNELVFSNVKPVTCARITIPLPPESNVNTPEEDFEMEQIAKNNDTQPSQVTFNTPKNLNLAFTTSETISTSGARQLDITVIDNDVYNHNDLVQDTERLRKTMEILNKSEMAAKMERVNKAASDSLNENGDNLIFGGDDKCKEWPCVGDEVLINIDFDKYDVKYGREVNGENGVVRSIFKDGDTTVYAVSVDGTCYCFVRGLLSKPKTPEEELIDKIESVFRAFSVNDYLRGRQRELAIKFIDDFNIKPQ